MYGMKYFQLINYLLNTKTINGSFAVHLFGHIHSDHCPRWINIRRHHVANQI